MEHPPATPRSPLQLLVEAVEAKTPLGQNAPPGAFTRSLGARGAPLYANRNAALNIDFTVDRLDFPSIQTLDPRVLRIAPGANNELHKHAHETLFVVLAGQGEVKVGERWSPMGVGDVAFVPRWIFHQTRNTSLQDELVVLAITDFGFTKAVLGDYDQRTRLAPGGGDVAEPTEKAGDSR
jgi:hypothetical protein